MNISLRGCKPKPPKFLICKYITTVILNNDAENAINYSFEYFKT